MPSPIGRAQPLRNKTWPKLNGPRGLNFNIPLNETARYEYKVQLNAQGIEWCTGVFVDNSENPQAFFLTMLETGQKYNVPAYSQMSMSLLGIQGDAFSLLAESTGGVEVPVIFMNIEGADVIWSVIDPGSIQGVVTVNGTVIMQPMLGAFTEAATEEITAGGTSQALFGANAARRKLIVYNPYTAALQGIATPESIFIRFGGVASSTDIRGCLEIAPGGVYDSGNGPVSNQAVNIVAATTGHRFTALEF